MNNLKLWFKGYVTAEITNKQVERFINICAKRSLQIYNMTAANDGYRFQIGINEYRELLPIVRKTKCFPKIIKKNGIPFLIYRSFKHIALIPGVLIAVLLIYILSTFLWDIQLEGNSLHTEEQMIQYLYDNKIGFGTRCSKIDCSYLEACIREDFPDIGWVSVELKGSRLTLRIKETVFKTVDIAAESEYRNMVAGQNGIVVDIITQSGTPMVKSGDVVCTGDVLIMGVLKTVDEYETVLLKRPTKAEGQINIRAIVPYEDKMSVNYKIKEYSGKCSYGIMIDSFNKNIFSYLYGNNYTECDIIKKTTQWKISNNLYLPISHTTISCMEYKEYPAVYSYSQLTEKMYQQYIQWLEQWQTDGFCLVSDQVKIKIKDETCFMSGTVIMEGRFWNYQELNPEELIQEVNDQK